ncbi:MAG: hypothetical protein F6K32_25265 [Desertifilum sp. SIO1I2]|nr:hypothetical protein [Desertifilum sp. SIO1I2]
MAQIHWQSPLGCTMLCFMFASAFSLPVASAFPIAQATPGAITEQVGFINTCRESGSTGLTLYEDAALTRAAGTIQPNTVVTLTGLVAPGIAQIKSPDVGWVRAATLSTNCGTETPITDATLPPDIDTNPIYCRRLRDSTRDGQAFSALDRGLIAYNTPGSGMQTYLGSPDGPARAATVRITRTPPETQTFEGNTWIRVKYTSVAGEARIGWVTNGPVGTNRNLANCLPGQN